MRTGPFSVLLSLEDIYRNRGNSGLKGFGRYSNDPQAPLPFLHLRAALCPLPAPHSPCSPLRSLACQVGRRSRDQSELDLHKPWASHFPNPSQAPFILQSLWAFITWWRGMPGTSGGAWIAVGQLAVGLWIGHPDWAPGLLSGSGLDDQRLAGMSNTAGNPAWHLIVF